MLVAAGLGGRGEGLEGLGGSLAWMVAFGEEEATLARGGAFEASWDAGAGCWVCFSMLVGT